MTFPPVWRPQSIAVEAVQQSQHVLRQRPILRFIGLAQSLTYPLMGGGRLYGHEHGAATASLLIMPGFSSLYHAVETLVCRKSFYGGRLMSQEKLICISFGPNERRNGE